MDSANAFMSVDYNNIPENMDGVVAKKNLVTIGFNDTCLQDLLGDGSYVEISYSDTESFIISSSEANYKNHIDAVLCSQSLSDNDIQKLVSYIHGTEALLAIPVVLCMRHANIKSKKEILDLGLDDIIDESIALDLFYERIELLRKTKQRLFEDPDDRLILSMVNIDININIFKRTGDFLISFFLLLALFPLFLIVAILIKIESRGPIFYTSKRAGAGYKIFDFYKFRSMAQDADQEMSKVLHLNQYSEGKSESNSVFYKIKGDPRVTKVGAFLRKTSIDELPQLINVLKGDMSLVGNRPLPLYEAQQLTRDNWVARFNAPAGITGLWQISKRGKAEMSEEERVQLDVEYSKKHSFWYDLWILISTIPVIFQEDDV